MPLNSKRTTHRLKTAAIATVVVAGLALIGLAVWSGKAAAADTAGKAPAQQLFNDPAQSPTQTWTGLYFGVEGGLFDAMMDPIFGVDGYLYGVRVGGDLQMGVIVAGAYVGYDRLTVSVGGSNVDANSLYYGARLGILPTAGKEVLVYGTAGQRNFDIDGLGKLDQNWFAGGGAQWRMTKNWSAGLEYTRTWLEDAPGNAHVNATVLSLSYKLPPLGSLK